MARTTSENRIGGTTLKQYALATVSGSVLMVAYSTGPAAAQAPPQTAQAPGQNAQVEEIVVTGTRVIRDGYEAPTPLTVVGIEQIEAAAPSNIADFVNQMPSISGSSTPTTSNSNLSSTTAGVNSLNLRNLGSNRTLVLVDGQRSVESTIGGLVDVSNFPQALVTRVDVVTGGASAQYGSDALSGVVNFVLDKKFVGLKGEVSGGVTTRGEDRNWKVTLTGGTTFAGDRGHLIISGELSAKDGIYGIDRAWAKTGAYVVFNPAYGTGAGQSTSVPQYLNVTGASIDNATFGGIITAGPLKGTAFGPGSIPYQFAYGSLTSDPWTVGGNWQSNQDNLRNTLDDKETRQGIFVRSSYDVADNVNLFLQGSWNAVHPQQDSAPTYYLGNLSIRADNPFLPASVAAQAAASKVTSFLMGKFWSDLPSRTTDNKRRTLRFVVGGDGKFDAFDTTWTWNAYYQKGVTMSSETLPAAVNNAAMTAALDATRNPATGAIVCRTTLTNPTNGCTPINIFGVGVVSQAAAKYVVGSPHRNEDFKQDVQAASMTGEPFATWAGPVSLALGIEHRRESVNGAVDPYYSAGWNIGNLLVSTGHYTVTEGFVETVVPLAKDTVWAKSFDFNGAVRATGYSTSGYVTTWKAGATYAPIDDIHFRFTKSRDIRAPNLSELFLNGASGLNTVLDRFNNNVTTSDLTVNGGNPNLQPEKADTTGFGVVVQPSFFPGFSASFDYYNIDVSGAISSLSAQQIVDLCYAGLGQQYCNALVRGTGAGGASVFTAIYTYPFNYVTQVARGYDIEASYTTKLDTIVDSWQGNFNLRFLATHYIKNSSDSGIPGIAATDSAGENSAAGPPKWRYSVSATYDNTPISLALTARGISGGTILNSWIECTSGCPVATTNHPTVNNNHMDGQLLFDANIAYKIAVSDAVETQVYLNIRNLTDASPAIFPQGPTGFGFLAPPFDPFLYDGIGRVFRAGVRFKM